MRNYFIACAAAALPLTASAAQPSFSLGTLYACPNNVSFKVTACAGPADSDLCDVQMYAAGQALRPGRSARSQIMQLLPRCAAQGQSAAGGGAVFAQQTPAASPGRPAGKFEEYDHVKVNIRGQGWMDGQIVGINNGIMEDEYKVQVPGKGVASASPQDLRFVSAGVAPGTVPPGQPPKPGLVSCAGKFEGRYASPAGTPGMVTVVFRSGKADVTTPDVVGSVNGMTAMASTHKAECWTGGGKIYLKWLDGPNIDFPMDINDDGTLDTPYGEIKKKGS
ncbi:MAG: hypothetical protein JO361_10775 [Gammaproteobacteria bacterium]|nr:hypothetical protein [Gammaproteobacteria bacterium]